MLGASVGVRVFGKQLLARVQVPLAGLLLLLKVCHLLSCFRAKSLRRENTLLDSCALALGVRCPLEAGLLSHVSLPMLPRLTLPQPGL